MSVSTTTAELTRAGAPRGLEEYRPSVRAWARWHPEWWALTLSALAWLEILGLTFARPGDGSEHGAMATMPGMTMGARPGSAGAATIGAGALGLWMLMVAAMMLPLAIGPLRTVAERSLWRRRQRAIVEYLVGFAGVWTIAGIALLSVRATLIASGSMPVGTSAPVLAGGLALAAAWQLTPYKRRALRACHRPVPLAPSGARAVRDCVAYGASGACSCLVSCGVAMGALVIGGSSLAPMLAVSAVAIAECYAVRQHARASTAALALVALTALAL